MFAFALFQAINASSDWCDEPRPRVRVQAILELVQQHVEFRVVPVVVGGDFDVHHVSALRFHRGIAVSIALSTSGWKPMA